MIIQEGGQTCSQTECHIIGQMGHQTGGQKADQNVGQKEGQICEITTELRNTPKTLLVC